MVMFMKYKNIISVIFACFIITTLHAAEPALEIERRAAVDTGSGSTKVTIADVDVTNGKIHTILFEESFPVPYQAALESSYDGRFDQNIRELGLGTFHKIHELLESYEVEKVAAVATAAFREANNGIEFADEVMRKTGIPLTVIPQREEGTLAYFSGIASTDRSPEELIVWDIGTGSFQMTTLNNSLFVEEQPELEDTLTVFMGGIGSIPFRNYIIEVIQDKDVELNPTPNPMTEEEVKEADRYARSIARKAYPLIKDKIKQPEVSLIGIGRLFSSSISMRLGPLKKKSMGIENTIVRKDLRGFIESTVGKSEEELDDPFAHVDISNAILVLAFMKALHIHEIQIVDTKSTRGMLIYSPYWRDAKSFLKAS